MSLAKLIDEKRKAKARAERNKKAKVAVTGAAVGTLAGVLGGLLFAPKSGKETRNDIKEGSKKAARKENISDAKSKIKEYLNSKKCKNIEEAVEENLNVPVEVADEATSLETEEVKESN